MINQIFERLWLGLALCLSLLFILAIAPDRMTWDQGMDFVGVQQQVAFAARVLAGTGTQDFRSIDSNYAFYGIGTTLPAYALSWLIDVPLSGRFHTYFNSFTLLLHVFAFLSALAAARLTGALVKLETGDAHLGEGAAIALLLVPPWIGYGFFDYKDMPVALGVIASVAFAARCREGGQRALVLFFAALLFLGAQKLAAVPLALPACAYVGFHVLRRRDPLEIATMAGLALALPLLLYAVTPPAWREPLAFAMDNLKAMAAHSHGGCVLTAGECIGRGPAEHPNLYSPLRYIGLWYAAQMPLGLLALAAVAGGCYVQRQGGGIRHLVAASIAWPLAAIVWNQSTLYDGIRHTLFLIPLLVAFVFCNIPAPWWRRGGRWLAAYGAALALQIGLASPYHYVWFNEAARFVADHRNYVTDYWAFSLGESIASAENLRRPDEYVVGMPYVLVAPSFEQTRMAASVADVPPGASYLVIAVTSELPRLPPECVLLSKVQRSQWPSPLTLDLSLVARCARRAE